MHQFRLKSNKGSGNNMFSGLTRIVALTDKSVLNNRVLKRLLK